MQMASLCKAVRDIFLAAVDAVKPYQMVKNTLIRTGPAEVTVNKISYSLSKNVYLVGFGKAVLEMAAAVEEELQEHLVCGAVSVPLGSKEALKDSKSKFLLPTSSKIEVFEGAENNMPDEKALHAAHIIQDLVKKLDESHLLFVLISGGGSALLPSPIAPVTLEEKCATIKMLVSHGATIAELNSVRRQLSSLKGGGLATLAAPAKTIGLILSDVIGNPLDVIASGPTVPNNEHPHVALEIIDRYQLQSKLPSSVMHVLQLQGNFESVNDFSHVTNIIIGSNSIATQQGCKFAESINFKTICLTTELKGEAFIVGEFFASLARAIMISYKTKEIPNEEILANHPVSECIPPFVMSSLWQLVKKVVASNKSLCVICGGETTVKLRGHGRGGRNQEMVLSCSINLGKVLQEGVLQDIDVVFLSAGTDGIDGPTPVAGALCTVDQITKAGDLNLDPNQFLVNNDSYTYFSTVAPNALIETGHTGTNVMDIQILAFKCK